MTMVTLGTLDTAWASQHDTPGAVSMAMSCTLAPLGTLGST